MHPYLKSLFHNESPGSAGTENWGFMERAVGAMIRHCHRPSYSPKSFQRPVLRTKGWRFYNGEPQLKDA
jgi:hypothetical protein